MRDRFWNIDKAYIKDYDIEKHDIGILELDIKYKKFFDPDMLLYFHNVFGRFINAEIIPICLGALNLKMKLSSKTEIKQLGWGIIYEEVPKAENQFVRDPIYSSCMTSQASPPTWRFQNCNMDHLKSNGWSCEKVRPPPDYKNDEERICKEYFTLAKKVKDVFDIEKIKTLEETRLKNVDLIWVNRKDYITGMLTQEKCYNPALLSTFGWCYLADYEELHKQTNWPGPHAWGICSPSCNDGYMQVSRF